MCVQVFFVRQGKLIERDVSLFPALSRSGRRTVDIYRPVLRKIRTSQTKRNFTCHQGIDREIVRQLLDVNVFIPQRGKKKDLVNLAIKNAQISLKEKFQLIERQE